MIKSGIRDGTFFPILQVEVTQRTVGVKHVFAAALFDGLRVGLCSRSVFFFTDELVS